MKASRETCCEKFENSVQWALFLRRIFALTGALYYASVFNSPLEGLLQ